MMTYLLFMIEVERQRMIECAEQYGMSSEKTIECSMQLDILLNVLFKLEKDEKGLSQEMAPSLC